MPKGGSASLTDSNVNLLVKFEPAARRSVFTTAEIELALSAVVGGRRVNLHTAGDLNQYFREEVVRMAEPQHEAR
jgi:predicted nucleotidyltransferase